MYNEKNSFFSFAEMQLNFAFLIQMLKKEGVFILTHPPNTPNLLCILKKLSKKIILFY